MNKISLIENKKYKSCFKKVVTTIHSDEEGDKYLVDKSGTVYKPYDELGD